MAKSTSTFGGIPKRYSSEASSKIVLLPVPFDETTSYQQGTDRGPAALIEASKYMELYDIETDSQVYLNGIYIAPAVKQKGSNKMLEAVYAQVKKFLNKGKFVATLGGEHSISYAPIRAHAEHYKKITVLQFDAHADLADTYGGDPWSHACAMARAKEIKGVEKIVSVGIRSMSHKEKFVVDRPNTFFAHEIADDPHWINRVMKQLTGLVYITFDLDVFDSSLVPSTGTPEPGGLFWYDAMRLLRRVMTEKKVVGLDIVELLPHVTNLAPDFLAAKLLYKILSYQFQPGKAR